MSGKIDEKRVLWGMPIAEKIYSSAKGELDNLIDRGIEPKLATIYIGRDPPSDVFLALKHKELRHHGIRSVNHKLDDVGPKDVLELIKKLNKDTDVHGIIVQLPIPKELNPYRQGLLDAVNPLKDVDGLSSLNMGYLMAGKPMDQFLQSCTALAVMDSLDFHCDKLEYMELMDKNGDFKGSSVGIIGRSILIGKPLMLMFLQRNATVSVYHTGTKNLEKYTSSNDILVGTSGAKGLITCRHLKEKESVFIDAGILLEGYEGYDFDFNDNSSLEEFIKSLKGKARYFGDGYKDKSRLELCISEKAEMYTPVPGGVGLVTVANVWRNAIKAARLQNQ